MTHTAINSRLLNDSPVLTASPDGKHHSRKGRCRMTVADPLTSLCAEHPVASKSGTRPLTSPPNSSPRACEKSLRLNRYPTRSMLGGSEQGTKGVFMVIRGGFAAATAVSVRQRPADHCHRQHQQQHTRADKAQGSPMAQQVIARFGVDAEKNGDDQHHAPGQQNWHARVPADHREEFPCRLPRRYPPGQQQPYPRRQRERQQFAREPAFDLWPGFFPHEIIPSQQSERQRHPAIHGRLLVEPGPSAEQDASVVRHCQPRQQKQAQDRVAKHGHKNRHQTHELEPVTRRHSPAASAHGLFGQEVQSTAVAIHGCSLKGGIQTSDHRELTALAVPKLLVVGSVLVPVFFLHNSFNRQNPAKYAPPLLCVVPFPRYSAVVAARFSCEAPAATPGLFATRSPEPGGIRPRFAALVLQVVQFLFQIRFSLFQILQLAIPIVDVRDIGFHPGGYVKTPAPELFDLVFFLGDLLFRLVDRVQYRPGPSAPLLLPVRLVSSTSIVGFRGSRPRAGRLPHNGYTRSLHSRQIVLGEDLAFCRCLLFCFGFARRFRERVLVLRRLVGSCGLSLGLRLSLGRRWL